MMVMMMRIGLCDEDDDDDDGEEEKEKVVGYGIVYDSSYFRRIFMDIRCI